MGDISQSASASAEANAVKLSGNTFNLSLSAGSGTEKPGALSNLIRAISPVYYERREAEAREIKAESIIATAKRLQDEFPAMSERRAYMEAMGYHMTNENADNVVETMQRGLEKALSKGDTVTPLLPETRDAIFEGSKAAYDDSAKELWARLMAGELTSPGSFSKRTMVVLRDMSPTDAEAFRILCSFGIYHAGFEGKIDSLLLVSHSDAGKINGGALSLTSQSDLESLGLIDSSLVINPPVEPGGFLVFSFHSELHFVTNGTDRKKTLSFSPVLTKFGREMATLCTEDIGSFPDLDVYFRKEVESRGLKVSGLNEFAHSSVIQE